MDHPVSDGARLPRAQRRRLQKLADAVGKVTAADAAFFERHPARRHRLRLAAAAEIEEAELLSGRAARQRPGFRFFMIVRCIRPGVRLRAQALMRADVETDLSEYEAEELWNAAVELAPQIGEAAHALQK